MTTIVIGGHSRKVGKTSVTEGLIRAFRQYPWTAVKISSHWHTDQQAEEPFLIREEADSAGQSDSSRYLAAGAARSFWVRVRQEQTRNAMAALLPLLQSSSFVIVESNAILQHIRPDLYIMVLRYDVNDFKDSARATLACAHAAVAINYESASPAWKDFAQQTMANIPLFTTSDPRILPVEFLDFVKLHLGQA